MEVLGRLVGESLLLPEIVEEGGGRIFVRFETGQVNQFLGGFPRLGIKDV